MYIHYCLLLLVCSSVICEDCLTVNFENDFEEKFSHTGVCSSRSMWSNKQYSTLNLGSPHPRSTSFVTPQSTISCMSSLNFTMHGGGTLELNRFMASNLAADYVIIEIFRFNQGGAVSMVATRAFGPSYNDHAQGWQTVRIPISGTGKFDVYVLFWGRVSPTSTMLIDSFRYVGPSLDRDLCVIYKDEEEQTTSTDKEPITKEPSSISPDITTIEDIIKPTPSSTTDIAQTEYPTSTAAPIITLDTTTVKNKPSSVQTIPPATEDIINETTTMMPANTSEATTTQTTPTKRPRSLSISILLIKIKKLFR